jgi:hypothetical protein
MTPMTSCATVPTTISDSAVETLNQIGSSVATNANPTRKAERAHAFVMEPGSFNYVQGSMPGQETPRQGSLSGVIICPAYWKGQRLKVNSLTSTLMKS